MATKLISVTHPLIKDDHERLLTAEEFIVYTARVSNPSNQLNTETAPKLLRYLIRNKHWSPLEMVNCCFEIVTSRAITQQITRHKSFSFQEYSLRYSEGVSFVSYEARRQDQKNRQNSIDDLSDDDKKWFDFAQSSIWEECYRKYKEALDRGIAKECARFLLPLNTESTILMNGSIRSWYHYLTIRCEKSTQLEHRQIALEILEQLKNQFPIIHEMILEEINK